MTEFSITHDMAGDVARVCLQGYLDAHTASEFESALGDIINKGIHKIVVNFKDLEYISSAGLGVFMVFIEGVRSQKGDIKLVEMKPRVFTVFDLLGFPMLFEIYELEGEALERFAA